MRGAVGGKFQILIGKCMNPVIYFDELDKVSDTPRVRDHQQSMHIIDTTQNSQFHDKYFRRLILILASVFLFSVITTRAR
jgi:ATP-dependent Lon protease